MNDHAQRLPRLRLNYYLDVLDVERGACIGRLVDLHGEGMKLVSMLSFAPGLIYRLRIGVVPGYEGDMTSFKVTARCVWSRQDVNRDLRVSGFSLLNVPENFEEHIQSLVRIFGDSERAV